MIARRDLLRLMAAASAANTLSLPFALSPAEAAAVLDAPVPFDPGIAPTPSNDARGWPIPSAGQFANTAWSGLDIEAFGWFEEGAPVEWAAYRQAMRAVADLHPESLSLAGINPLSLLDEEVLRLCITSWDAGVRVGAELEHLRQAMLRPVQVCPRCHGDGRAAIPRPVREAGLRADDPPGLCPACGGSGTVPIIAV